MKRIQFSSPNLSLHFSPNTSEAKTTFSPRKQEINAKRYRKTIELVSKVETVDMEREMKILQWRKVTNFPIVKVYSFQRIIKNFSSESDRDLLSKYKISLQRMSFSLQNLENVFLFKILYLLKETLIAAERLFHLFGYFFLTSEMVGVNPQGKCKVWSHSQFQLNFSQCRCQSSLQMVNSLVFLFRSKTKVSKKSIEFYRLLSQQQNLVDCLKVLKQFSLQHKIRIPKIFVNERGRMKNFMSCQNIKYSIKEVRPYTFAGVQDSKKDIIFPRLLQNFKKNKKLELNKLVKKLLVSTVDSISVCESINNECTAELGPLCKSVVQSYIIQPSNSNNVINVNGNRDLGLQKIQQSVIIAQGIKCV